MLKVGDFRVWTICDGYLDVDLQTFFGLEVEKKRVRIPVNSFLIENEKNLVLVDTGVAKFFGPHGGGVEKELKKIGYEVKDVFSILLTHLHPDHIAGLSLFSHANIFISRKELLYWSSENNLTDRNKRYLPFVRKTMEPFKNQIISFEPEEMIFPGIKAVAAYGHTEGHVAFFIESNGEKLLLCGDLCSDIQLNCLERAVIIDADPESAILSRTTIFKRKANEGFRIGGAHITGFI